MREASFKTLGVNQLPPSAAPFETTGSPTTASQICGPVKDSTRVLIRNTSLGVDVFISFEEQSLLSLPDAGGGIYVLPAGFSDEFYLMKDQRLFAAASAANARISVAISPWFGAKELGESK